MIGVDTWCPRPENKGEGKETYTNWNHEANEKTVREGAEPYGERATILKMDTHEAADLVGKLDFVFIDADHSYEGVEQDIQDWAPKCQKFVIGHDWDWPSVRQAAEETFSNIETGPDNVWYVRL